MVVMMINKKSGLSFSITALLLCATVLFAGDNAFCQTPGIEKLIGTKKGFDENTYPVVKHTIFNFTVIDPGVALVPAAGGIYMAGWKKWFLTPSKINLPYAVDYLPADSSLYFFAATKTKCIVVKLVGPDTAPSFKKILEMPVGNYNLKCATPNLIWIWGKQNGVSCIWRYDMQQLKLFYISPTDIVDLSASGENDIVIATKNTVVTLGLKHSPKEVIKTDIPIDGVAADFDGTLYVSTQKGILHYLSPELISDADVITYGIHGMLRRYGKGLYVLWRENNEILKINL
jgi:hypothetical protein